MFNIYYQLWLYNVVKLFKKLHIGGKTPHANTIRYYRAKTFLPLIITIITAFSCYLTLTYKQYVIFSILIALGIMFLVYFIKSICNIICYKYYIKQCKKKIERDSNLKGVITISGPNRSGKSADAGETFINKCRSQWRYVCRIVKMYKSKLSRGKKLSKKEFEDYEEARQTYDFFKKHKDLIPCGVSNTSLIYKGKRPLPVKSAHLMQVKKQPSHICCYIDEASYLIDIEVYKDRPEVFDNYVRFFGHYLGSESLLIFTEQDPNKEYIGIKRSNSYIKLEKGQEHILPAKNMKKAIDKLSDMYLYKDLLEMEDIELKWFEKLMLKFMCASKFSDRIYNLLKLYSSIGFRRFNFTMKGNTEFSSGVSEDSNFEYAPSSLNYYYNNRMFKKHYKCSYKKIEYDCFIDEYLPEEYEKEKISYDKRKKKTVFEITPEEFIKNLEENKKEKKKFASQKIE